MSFGKSGFLYCVIAAMTAVCSCSVSSPPQPQESVPSKPAPEPAFVVAIATSHVDGSHLEPIARFTGTSWINTWPAFEDANGPNARPAPPLKDLPDAWLGKPTPLEWAVWSSNGGMQKVRVVGTRRGDSCFALIQLTISPETPIRLDGSDSLVAVDTDRHVDGFRAVTDTDAEWQPLSAFVRELYTDNEQSAFSDSHLRISPADLKDRPIQIEYFVRPVSPDAPSLYYFEAAKHIQRPQLEDTGVVVSGWIRQQNNRKSAYDVEARGIVEDKNPIPQNVPLASFHLMNRDFFLVEFRGYEGSAASIVESTPDGMRRILEVPRASC